MDSSNHHAPDQAAASRRTLIASALLTFLVAFGVRLLSWHDTRLEVGKVQTAVTADYKRVAQLLRQGGVAAFLSRTSPLSDANNLGHPPGYPILMAAIPSRFGKSETAIQFVPITCDAITAAVIVLIVAPLTIRNAIVFHRFIPLSLGAGQTLLEGIADYDPQAKFGIPNTDTGIMKLEAEEARRPDYDQALFNPDGIERERWRLSRGLAVIRAHPFWF